VDISEVPSEYRRRISPDGTIADFSGRGWTELPAWLANFTKLTYLYLSGNQLTHLPDWLGTLNNLTFLNLSDNQLTHLPDTLADLTNLTTLGLSSNKLTELPTGLGNLAKLTDLALDGNKLVEIPRQLGGLTNLTDLHLSRNQLTHLPDALIDLSNIIHLSLSGNQLTRLPDWLGTLTTLGYLSLNDNQLTHLPDTLADLTNLSTLGVNGNKLTDLPSWLADFLTDEFVLWADGNPLREPLPWLLRHSNRRLAAYLRSLRDAVPLYEAKLLLVGEGNVGKSSLVAALKGAPFVEGRETTHGIEISPVLFRHPSLDLDMTLRVWDFGGQEVYRVSHQFFFSPRALYLVVWHARQGQERDEVEGWLRRIRLRVGDDAAAMIVATHCRERLADLDLPYLEHLFPGMIAGAFEIDSSTGDGIEGLRMAISERAETLPQMGQRISPRWTASREAVLARAESEPQIPYQRFVAICAEHQLADDEVDALAKLMHDLGLIIYYDADAGLKDVVVLNPEWLTRAISYVLDDNATADAGGVLDHARLKEIWQDRAGYPAQYHPYFLRLMEKFDISYRLDGDETHSLVPQLVPHQRPALPWQRGSAPPPGIRSLSLTCRLSEAAPGLIPWLTVRHHRASTGRLWRRGVFLRHPIDAYRSEALLELIRDNALALEVRAPSPDLYFNVLRDSIEDLIARRWPGLGYRLDVPCPGTAPDGTPCQGQFPLDGLLKVREAGQTNEVPCMECGQLKKISVLLTGFTVPAGPLATEIEQIHGQLTEITAGVSGLRGQAAELAGIADTIRRVYRIVSTEVTNCPRLFTLRRKKAALADRARFHQDHYQLTLWCEHPGYEHPWAKATYDLDPPKEWFVNVAPYARLVFRTLQLVVPVAAAIDLAALPSATRGDAQARLDVMQAIVDDLPADGLELTGREFADQDGGPGKLTPPEGQALRAVRQLVFASDPLRSFGDMRRVQAPSGDLLWVCPVHYPEYDPGLPKLP
jgi:internalin A